MKAIIIVHENARVVDAGLQFCSVSEEEFDRVTAQIRLLATDGEMEGVLEPLHRQTVRRLHEAGVVLGRLQGAVESWRAADEAAGVRANRTRISDATLTDKSARRTDGR